MSEPRCEPTPAEIEALVVAAQEAELTFYAYAAHHAAKVPPDTDKAARNRREAAALRAALAPFVARTYGE